MYAYVTFADNESTNPNEPGTLKFGFLDRPKNSRNPGAIFGIARRIEGVAMIAERSVHALEMGTHSSERVVPSLAVEQKRRIRIAMISISAIAVALACTVLVLESSSTAPAPVSGALCVRGSSVLLLVRWQEGSCSFGLCRAVF